MEVGEISTRFAQEVGDNGYLRLTNVRIPRTDMLMKLATVRFSKIINKTILLVYLGR